MRLGVIAKIITVTGKNIFRQCSRSRRSPCFIKELKILRRRRQQQRRKTMISLVKAPSTRIRKFVKTQIFFYEYGLRPHVSSVFSGRIRKFLKTLSRVEIFLSDTNTYTCGRSYPQICEYAYVILLDPVLTTSIKQTWRTARLCLLC